MNKPLFVFYHTKHYAPEAQRLISSLEKFNLEYFRHFYVSDGTWLANVNFKPCFLKMMMITFPDRPIVYLDADAEVLQHPALFFILDVPFAVHQVDWSLYREAITSKEILSGTIFVNNSDESHKIIDKWMLQCQAYSGRFDQLNLEAVLNMSNKPDWFNLPAEYCCIFDLMKKVENPVILHHQASRRLKELVDSGTRI